MEIVMHLEATPGGGETSTGMAQVQSQLTNITMQLQDMAKAKVVHEHVWCTMCHIEGHHRNECPTLGIHGDRVHQIHFQLDLRPSGVIFADNGDIYLPMPNTTKISKDYTYSIFVSSANPWGMM
jgi:hypothetical protein